MVGGDGDSDVMVVLMVIAVAAVTVTVVVVRSIFRTPVVRFGVVHFSSEPFSLQGLHFGFIPLAHFLKNTSDALSKVNRLGQMTTLLKKSVITPWQQFLSDFQGFTSSSILTHKRVCFELLILASETKSVLCPPELTLKHQMSFILKVLIHPKALGSIRSVR